ncbi:MAG: chemotaxis protein CheW [Proteobacteria bacterium]|nr:chemotaxis protein CheW [Pseudomonadota bacterium]
MTSGLGPINFLIPESTMCEVVQNVTICPLPNTPSWIQGLINLRGILVPVLNLKTHLGQKSEGNIKNIPLLVIYKGERAFATYVDALPNSINLKEENFVKIEIPDTLPEILKPYINNAFGFEQETWIAINYDAFIQHITKYFSDNPSADDPFSVTHYT